MSSVWFGGAPDPREALRNAIAARPSSETLAVHKRLARLEVLEDLQAAGRAPVLPVEFTSQYGEDCWLRQLFHDQLDGFFIEVGAYDGYTYSVSYPFEAMGWKGLLIEPIPDQFERARARRIGSRVVNAALAGPGSAGTCTFNVVQGETEGMFSYLSPTATNQALIKAAGARTRPVSVPLTTMNDALGQHEGPIDFAVIDVESGEIDLLKGFDLNHYRPRVLMIEEGLPEPRSPVSDYLSNFQYTQVAYLWINRILIRSDETDLIRRARLIYECG